MHVDLSTVGDALKSTYLWFVLKLLLGTLVAYILSKYIQYTPDGVIIHWPLYIVGVGAVAALWLISYVKGDYLRRMDKKNPNRRVRKKRR